MKLHVLLAASVALLPGVAPAAVAQVDAACPPEHAAMGHCTPAASPVQEGDMAGHSHAGHDMSGMDHGHEAAPDPHGTGGTALPAGNASPPVAPDADYADRVWGKDAMAPARAELRQAHGGGMFSQVMFDLAEYVVRDGQDGFRWDAEGWFGGDINRLVVKAEGAGVFGDGVEDAELHALYSRAIGPYFNLQAGIRHDLKPDPSRTYATVGFEGLAPYWFEVEGAVFVSDKGDLTAQLKGYYDQRISQKLILQPRAGFSFAAQDVPENGIGSGLSDIELGLRLRYEIAREFAPYIGMTWGRRFGDTARLARANGEDVETTNFVIGIRAWF